MRQLADTTFPVNTDLVAHALEWLEAMGEQQAWPARTRFKLQLCLDETLTNIFMYGYAGHQPSQEPQVQLRLHQDGADRLLLEIRDNGLAYDPTAHDARDLDASLDEARPGGHGLRLMRHYLRDIRYERQGDWNSLTLEAVLDNPDE